MLYRERSQSTLEIDCPKRTFTWIFSMDILCLFMSVESNYTLEDIRQLIEQNILISIAAIQSVWLKIATRKPKCGEDRDIKIQHSSNCRERQKPVIQGAAFSKVSVVPLNVA